MAACDDSSTGEEITSLRRLNPRLTDEGPQVVPSDTEQRVESDDEDYMSVEDFWGPEMPEDIEASAVPGPEPEVEPEWEVNEEDDTFFEDDFAEYWFPEEETEMQVSLQSTLQRRPRRSVLQGVA